MTILTKAKCWMTSKPITQWDCNTGFVSFAGYDRKKGKDDLVYVAVNAYWEEVKITLPNLANHGAWYLSVDTYGDEKGKYFYQEGEEIRIDREYVMKPRSIVVFTGREILR